METIIPRIQFPAHAKVDIEISVSCQINVTPFTELPLRLSASLRATQKVNRFLTMKVGNLLRAGTPELVVGSRLLWRVPIIYSIPSKGKLGKVGEISVDAETGELLVEQMTPREVIEAGAESLLKMEKPGLLQLVALKVDSFGLSTPNVEIKSASFQQERRTKMTDEIITTLSFDELPTDDESAWERFDAITDEELEAIEAPDNPGERACQKTQALPRLFVSSLTDEQLKQFRRSYYVKGEKVWEDEKTIDESSFIFKSQIYFLTTNG